MIIKGIKQIFVRKNILNKKGSVSNRKPETLRLTRELARFPAIRHTHLQ